MKLNGLLSYRILTTFLAGAVLQGCEYLPHSAKVDLTPEQIEKVIDKAQPANSAIMRAFATHQVVGLGDYHWNDAFIFQAIELIRDPEFAKEVQHVVVEFGNAKHQELLNQYLRGEDVPDYELQQVVRDSIYFMAWTPEVYLSFFKAVREQNKTLPLEQQIIVHLAEAPFDWTTVKSEKTWKKAAKSKTDYFYKVTEEILNKGDKALLIFGAFHLVQAPAQYVTENSEAMWPLATRLEKHFPEQVYLVWPMTEAVVLDRFSSASSPSILPVSTTPLASTRFIDLLPKSRFKLADMGEMNAKTGDLFDAFLYVSENKRSEVFPKAMMEDKAWLDEMDRRLEIIGGKMQEKFVSIKEQSEAHYGL